jgi:hypothetical protein
VPKSCAHTNTHNMFTCSESAMQPHPPARPTRTPAPSMPPHMPPRPPPSPQRDAAAPRAPIWQPRKSLTKPALASETYNSAELLHLKLALSGLLRTGPRHRATAAAATPTEHRSVRSDQGLENDHPKRRRKIKNLLNHIKQEKTTTIRKNKNKQRSDMKLNPRMDYRLKSRLLLHPRTTYTR